MVSSQTMTLDSLLKVTESEISKEQLVDTYVHLADVYGPSDTLNSFQYSDKAAELALQIGYQFGRVDALYMHAAMYMSVGQIHKAAIGFQEVVDESIKIGYQKGEAKGNNGLGATRDFQGDYAGALEYLFKALKINEALGDKRSAASRYNNIGLTYASQGDNQNAVKYFNRALDVYYELDNQESIALVSGNIGELYLKDHKLDEARDYFNRSLKIYLDLNDRLGIANVRKNLGDLYREFENIPLATSYYEKALVDFDEIGSLQFVSYVNIGLGLCHMNEGNWVGARTFLLNGIEDASEIDHILNIRDGWKHLAFVEEKLGNFREALEAQKNYNAAADRILNTEQTRRLTLLEADYYFQKERDSTEFEQQRATLAFEKEIEREKWIQYSFFGLAVFLGIIALLSYRSFLVKKEKNKSLAHKNELIKIKNEELTSKNSVINDLRVSEKTLAEETLALKERELTTVTMLSHEKNTILERLGEQIGLLSSKVDQEVLIDLKEIKKIIKSGLNEETWTMFMYQFEKVHPQFYNKLRTDHPTLTQHDLRLCAYLRVGMDNKEIANVFNVTTASVKKSINRMKKKMELDATVDLRDFLLRG